MQPLSGRDLVRAALALLPGVLVGVVGTVMHRSARPWGLVLSLALVLGVAVAVRAWAGLGALLAYGGALALVATVMAFGGPGGDVLVPAGQAIGWSWLVGAYVLAGVAAFLPAGLFRDADREAGGPAGVL